MAEGYDPEWIAFEKELGGRPGRIPPPEQYQDWARNIGKRWPAEELPQNIHTRDQKIDDKTGVRIYTPLPTSPDPLPVGVWYHGGGLISGDLDSEDTLCRYIAGNTPCIVVSVDYTYFPKQNVHQQIEDALAAYEWIYKNRSSFGGDPDAFFVLGGSAGGILALSVTKKLVESGRRYQVQGLILLHPITSHPLNPPEKYKQYYKSYKELETGAPLLNLEVMAGLFDQVLKVDPKDDDVFVSRINPETAAKFPPTFIATAGKDVLRDDGSVMAAVLSDAGVDVQRHHVDGFPHYFFLFPPIKKRLPYLDAVVEGINHVLKIEDD